MNRQPATNSQPTANSQPELPEFPLSEITIVLPVNVLLSLATGPVLIGMVLLQIVLQSIVQMGETSEEILRGDRLPTLKLPTIGR